MRAHRLTFTLVVAGLIASGCGGSDTASDNASASPPNCGQPSGVPGQIVIVQKMGCVEAAQVAQAYYGSERAPRLWYSDRPNASHGWQCNGELPSRLKPAIAQCTSYSTAASAQTQLAKGFEVREAH
jgi:hypothetical protein